MGIYSEYLDMGPTLDLVGERKKQLTRIAAIRGREILVYASDSNKARQGAQVSIDNSDLLPFTDQIANLKGKAIDVLLETGGGSGETTEDIVRMLRGKYESVAFIVPGMAKSAGTIMVMAGDEILMEPSSSLGPIDAQIQSDGKVFSAEAFLVGLEQIKSEVAKTNSLNRAYVPILQRISPGEIQHAQNALDFAKELVTRWLRDYKFKNWTTHRTHAPGTEVTSEQKEAKAKEIADALCDHSRHLSHGRSIKIPDLKAIGLEITDYSQLDELSDAIRRYHVLLQITFETAAVFKIFETTNSQIMRYMASPSFLLPGLGLQNLKPTPETQPPQGGTIQLPAAASAVLGFQCGNCKRTSELQVDFQPNVPLKPGALKFPSNDTFVCPQCNVVHNLTPIRRQVELQMKKKTLQ